MSLAHRLVVAVSLSILGAMHAPSCAAQDEATGGIHTNRESANQGTNQLISLSRR